MFAYTAAMGRGDGLCGRCGATMPEVLCVRCAVAPTVYRVYMHFQYRDGWQVTFLEADLKTPLQKRLVFQDEAKVVGMAERGGALKRLEDRQALETALKHGRGGVFLLLTPEQYRRVQ